MPKNFLILSFAAVFACQVCRADPDNPASRPSIQPRKSGSGTVATGHDWPSLIARTDPGSRDGIPWCRPDFDDSDWKSMHLPALFDATELPGHDGVVWFRKTITITKEIARQRMTLQLGPIDDMDVTWINGKSIGGYEQPGNHTQQRNYLVIPGVLREGKNVIAIRVMDHGLQGGFTGNPGQMRLVNRTVNFPLSGEWKYRAGADIETLTAAEKKAPRPLRHPGPFENGFSFLDRDVIAVTGGTGTVRQGELGYLETLLHRAARPKTIYFRNLAWQADTVYLRQRPRNFGSHLDQLNRVDATTVISVFGQMEALDGAERIPAFLEAYGKLLDEYAEKTRRIILVTPRPFERPASPHLPDLSAKNESVAAYAGAIRQLAERRGFLCLDLTGFDPKGKTSDGIQLTETGHWDLAFEMVARLTGASPVSGDAVTREGTFEESRLESIRQAAIRKNFLWTQNWRPTNWAFAYGNRQHVPSSHDHRPGKPRWMPIEIDGIIGLIEKEEEIIEGLQ